MLRFQLKGSVSLLFYRNQEESGQGGGGGGGGKGSAGVGLVKSTTEKLGLEALFRGAESEGGKSQCGVTPCLSRARTPRVNL